MWKTNVETLEGRVYTDQYRVYGLLHALAEAGMVEHLNNKTKVFLPVVDAMVYDRGHSHPPTLESFHASPPFMAVPKEKILWVLGGTPATQTTRKFESRRMAVFFGNYFLRGDLRLVPGARTSDFLNGVWAEKPFQCLYDASLVVLSERRPLAEITPLETFDFVTLNLRNTTGVCELPAVNAPAVEVTTDLLHAWN